ncbi:hypothetical protein P4576_22745 [Peribacillus frigoritolerans]|uniref:hypothetical protein n=1 Tax=Peribacillus frigoritolerans TaxID=450367 RepID=UPI002E1BAD75|nr:hypothetical protein [Peribacillus frigoritolerans]
MPVWLFTQVCLLCFWLIIGIYIYYKKLWKATFPVSKKYFFLFTFVLFVPSFVSLSSIVFGLIYLLSLYESIAFSKPVLFLLIIPGIYLSIILLFILIKHVSSIKQENKQTWLKEEIRKVCYEWIKQFSFLKEDMYNIKVYLLDNEVEGRIKIKNLTLEQLNILNEAEKSLPDNIYLYLVTKRV